MATASPSTKLQTPGAREISQPNKRSEQGGYWHQTSSQIIENAPAANDGKRISHFARATRYQVEDPRRYLPVAANPTMLTLAIGGVVERQVFEQFDFRGQPDARMSPFNQVMTKQRLQRKTIRENAAECPEFVNRLAMKDGFAKQICWASETVWQ